LETKEESGKHIGLGKKVQRRIWKGNKFCRGELPERYMIMERRKRKRKKNLRNNSGGEGERRKWARN